jgi:hypothetical protein
VQATARWRCRSISGVFGAPCLTSVVRHDSTRMSKRATIVTCTVLVCLSWVVVSRQNRVGLPHSYRPDDVSLVFGGVTTNSAGAALASFHLRNHHGRAICYVLGAPQIQNDGEWPNRLPPIGNPRQVVVRPNREAEFSVPIPITSHPWRVPVAYLWAPSLYQRFTNWTCLHVLRRPRNAMKTEEVQAFTIFTPTITR